MRSWCDGYWHYASYIDLVSSTYQFLIFLMLAWESKDGEDDKEDEVFNQ
jgi:hypothetical protein